MSDRRVNHRKRAIRRLGCRRVVAVAYVAAWGVGAVASRQKRMGLIRDQVVPPTRREEVLKVHQLPHSRRLQMRLPTPRESPCAWVVPVTRGEEVLN